MDIHVYLIITAKTNFMAQVLKTVHLLKSYCINFKLMNSSGNIVGNEKDPHKNGCTVPAFSPLPTEVTYPW